MHITYNFFGARLGVHLFWLKMKHPELCVNKMKGERKCLQLIN